MELTTILPRAQPRTHEPVHWTVQLGFGMIGAILVMVFVVVLVYSLGGEKKQTLSQQQKRQAQRRLRYP